MRQYWIFSIGTGQYPPPEDWVAEWRHHTAEMWFPPNKRPSGVRRGDRAVIRGTLGAGFVGVAEVTSDEPERNDYENLNDREEARRARKTYPWKLSYKLLVAIRADEHAPSLEDVGWENPRRLSHQPHVRIGREMYDRISRAIVHAAQKAASA